MALKTTITPKMVEDKVIEHLDTVNEITDGTAEDLDTAIDSIEVVAEATPSISVSSAGVITAATEQSKGYVKGGTKTATKNLTTKGATTITPSTATQTAVSSGMYTTGAIKVAPIPNQRSAANVTVSGKDVTTAAGYYTASVTKSVATVARANTTLSGTATNNTIVYTAANNQGTGYVTGANKTASKTVSLSVDGKTVTASDGSASISADVAEGAYDATVELISGDGWVYVAGTNIGLTSATTKPTSGYYITAQGSGEVTATATAKVTTSGYISEGAVTKSTGTESATATEYYTINTETKTVTPTKSAQSITPSTKKLLSKVTVNAIPDLYVDTTSGDAAAADILEGKKAWVDGIEVTGTIATKTSSDLTASGAKVTVPAGYYATAAEKSVTTASRAGTSITTTADDTNDKLTIKASNNQSTGYVTGSNKTATKIVTLSVAKPTIDASGNVTSVATAQDNSTSPVKVSKTSEALALGTGSLSVSGNTVTASKGYYSAETSKSVATVSRAITSMTSTVSSGKLVINASNNQGTGYVTGANKTASKTVSLSVSGKTVTASDGTNSISTSVATVARADTTLSSTATNNTLVFTAGNDQGTGYVTGANKTATKTVSLTASGASVTASDGTNSISTSVTTGSAKTPATTIAAVPTLSTTYTSGKGYRMYVSKTQGITPDVTAGYVSSGTSGTITVTGEAYVPAGGCTIAGGGLSVTKNYSGTPTVDITLSSQTTAGVAITDTKPTSGYYLTLGASSSALSGITEATSAPVTDTHTAGYIPAKTATTVIASAIAQPTVTVNKGTKTEYITIPTGGCTVSGGGLSKGAGSVSATGTNIGLTATATKPTSGYYITASGYGAVSRAAVTDAHTAGYIPAKTATTVIAAASATSNTATKYYTLSTETRTVTPSEDTQTLTPSSNKLISKVTINPIPSEYKDTSSGDALASHIIDGKKAWVDGKEVTGTLPYYSGRAFEVFFGATTDTHYEFDSEGDLDYCYLEDELTVKVPRSEFGDASSAHVISGNTFTSAEGWRITGTLPEFSTLDAHTFQVSVAEGSEQGYIDVTAGHNDRCYSNGIIRIPVNNQEFGAANLADVLEGVTFTSSSGLRVTGTMPNKGAVTQALDAGGSYTIPKGYHNGSGKVTANSLASQTSGTAAAGHILKGKTAWVNGSQITGTVIERGDANLSHVSTSGTITVTASPGMYTGGASYTITDSNLTAANIKSGTTIFGVEGTFTNISSGGASAAHILKDKKAYVNGALVTGTLATYSGATTITPTKAAQQFETAGKYLSGKLTVQAIPDKYIDTTISTDAAAAGSILTGKKAYVNGSLVTGSIPSRSDANLTKAITSGQITVQASSGYYPSNSSITFTDSNLTAANIRSGATVFGVEGTFTSISSNGATASDIKSGKKAYVNGNLVTGTLATYSGATSITPSKTAQQFETAARYVGSKLTVQAIPDKYIDTTISSNGAVAADIASGKKAYVNGSLVTGTLTYANPSISVASTGIVTATANGKSATLQISSTHDADLVASNIRKDITILGVKGTYTGDGITLNTYTVNIKKSADISDTVTVYYTNGAAQNTSTTLTTTGKNIYVAEGTTMRVVGSGGGYYTLTGLTSAILQTNMGNTSCAFFPASRLVRPNQTVTFEVGSVIPIYDYSILPGGFEEETQSTFVFYSAIPQESIVQDDIFVEVPKEDFGDAAAANVLSGKTFTSAAGIKINGTMPTKTSSDVTVSGRTVTIPAGYYGTAVTKNVGTAKAAATITPTTTNQTIAAGTYCTGAQTIAGDPDLVAGNIKKGVSIFGVTGTYEGSGGGVTLGKCTVTLNLNTFGGFGNIVEVIGYTTTDGSTINSTYLEYGPVTTPVTLSNVLCGSCITIYHSIEGYITSKSDNITTLRDARFCAVIKAPTTNGATGSVVFTEDT